MHDYFSESTRDFVETATVGGFLNGSRENTFDGVFESTHTNMSGSINTMMDINTMIKNKALLGEYKDALLSQIYQECVANEPDVEMGTHANTYQQLNDMFDNCTADLVKESAMVGQLLPIKTMDYPVLIKEFLKIATKDIMQSEVTKSPIIKKHIEQSYAVSKQDRTKRFAYPQCFFDGKFKELFDEGKGLPIKDTPVSLPAYKFDVVGSLTDAVNPQRENFTMDLHIIKAIVEDPDGEEIVVPFQQPVRINLADRTWVGGALLTKVTDSKGAPMEIDDVITGTVDFINQTVSINSLNGQIKKVIFEGYLSNEKNERGVTFEYEREEREWKIEDGTRASVPYSIETLEDHKALLDMDLYQKTYNHIGDYLAQMEDSDVLLWLDKQFELYDGVELTQEQLLGWSGFVTKRDFDFDSTSITTALPVEYIAEMLKFTIDGLITDIADTAKLDELTFVIYGNPRFVRMLEPKIKWISRPGNTSNGVRLDYSYGVMTCGDCKVQIVSTKKVNAEYDRSERKYSGLRIIPFPISKEKFTFKHYTYTTHLLTNANSGYRDADLPGGSKTYIMGVSRYKNCAIQGIQAQVKYVNAEPYIKIGIN